MSLAGLFKVLGAVVVGVLIGFLVGLLVPRRRPRSAYADEFAASGRVADLGGVETP